MLAARWRPRLLRRTIGVPPTASRTLARAPDISGMRPGMPLVLPLRLLVALEQVLHDGLLEQLEHRLAAEGARDAVVVLVGDERDVAHGGDDLLGVERLAAEDRVAEHDHVAVGHERE